MPRPKQLGLVVDSQIRTPLLWWLSSRFSSFFKGPSRNKQTLSHPTLQADNQTHTHKHLFIWHKRKYFNFYYFGQGTFLGSSILHICDDRRLRRWFGTFFMEFIVTKYCLLQWQTDICPKLNAVLWCAYVKVNICTLKYKMICRNNLNKKA